MHYLTSWQSILHGSSMEAVSADMICRGTKPTKTFRLTSAGLLCEGPHTASCYKLLRAKPPLQGTSACSHCSAEFAEAARWPEELPTCLRTDAA